MWLFLLLISAVGYLIYKLLKPEKNFWASYGVPQVNSSSLYDKIQIFIGTKTVADLDDVVYDQMGSDKFCGFVELQQPTFLAKDLEIVKKLLIKDFDHFVDRRGVGGGTEKQEILKKMVFNLQGELWKGVRTSLSPTFTTGKIRRMMQHFNNVANEWVEHLKDEIKSSKQSTFAANMTQEANGFTVDAIAAAVFGMNAGTIRNPQSIFSRMVRKLSDFSTFDLVKFGLAINFPNLIKTLGIPLLDQEAMDFFINIFSQGMKTRMEGKEKRNDFIQLIVEARKGELKSEGSDEVESFEKEAQISADTGKKNYLNDDDIANAQALGFFFAGFNTTSNFIGFILYLLALNPEVQNKLREEINSQLFEKSDGKNIDYDKLNQLTYLEMVFCEVLRKYPALGRLERICVKDYSDPTDNIRIPKGAMVAVPVQSIHNDKQYYEYPDKFYPEHFTPENKAKRNPYAWMPFGIGPRNCIGMRFALIETKAAIAHIVHSFEIVPTAKTPVPIKVRPVGQGVQIPDDLELGFKLAN